MSILKTLREPKILDMAIFDLAAVAMLAISYGIYDKSLLSVISAFVILIIVGIVVHATLCIPTMLNAYIGINKKEDVYAARFIAS